MQEQGKSRKPLIIGIVAAVAILAVVLVLLLTQCTGGNTGATTTPSAVETTEPVPTYELYWNADRAEYDGKSEAGMSSRMPEDDGYFHVRFILDGEEVVLKVADRKLINAIDVKDLMGLEFDENGIVIGVVSIDDMPLEKIGWQFYVQSAAKTLIKLNSSESMNGMEVLLETDGNTGIYDMTGKSGPVGNVDEPINMDRVYAVANLAGEVTHVFIYQRPNYMLTHEAECQHCKKVVTWYEWVKEDEMPVTTGHYQLQNDIQLNGQPAQQEDAKTCIDLNGKRVDGKSGSRCYAMFNAGTELAIMDTSEGQTGVMAAHGKGDQGMVVWVRYGAFYLYGGTLDASDATTKLTGTAIEAGKGKFVYMYGGTIIGGTAEPQQTASGGWTAGLGGAISLGGKFVMNGGVIRDGYAKAHVTWTNGNPSYSRGIGGNIYMSSSAVFELNDGEIKNGKAGNLGGNIYMEGTAEFTMNGGKITGGYINGKGRNGGNLYIGGQKTVFTMNGGYIQNGQSRNCAGNVYLNGTFNMNGGVISGGRIRDFKTGATVENASSANVFVVNGQFFMRGGKVAGGFQLIDTDAKKNETRLHLSGLVVIDGGEECTRNLVLSQGGSNIKVTVGTLHEKSNIRVYATTGYFTEKTKEANEPMFSSDIPEADVFYHDERLALGRLQCICGSNSDNVEDHKGACKEAGGEKVVFAPWTSGTGMPNLAGNYYLVNQSEVLNMANTSIVTPGDGKGTDVVVNVDLNGKQITSKSGRWYSLFENAVSKNPDGTYAGNIADEHIELSICDSVGTAKVTLAERASSDMGYLIWGRYNDSKITIYGGTYDGSALSVASHNGGMINTAGELNIYGGTFDGGNSVSGGIISVSGSKAVFNFYDGVIKNGTASYSGGNVYLAGNATMNMYGGSIIDGSSNEEGTLVGDLGYGGNIEVNSGTFNMYDGEIAGGVARIGVKGENASGTTVNGGGGLGGNLHVGGGTVNLMGGVIIGGEASTGGNIGTNNANSTIILDGVQVLDGKANGSGGNIAINVRAGKLLEIKGNTLISGGYATGNGGNLYLNAWAANGKNVTVNISGGTVENGVAGAIGGNLYMLNSTSGDTAGKNIVTMSGGTISGGQLTDKTLSGGSIYIAGKSEFVLNGGTVTGGSNAKQGGNFYLSTSTSKLTVNGGEILNGDTNDCGGNIQLQGRAVLEINGGVIKGGTRNGAYGSNSNIYSVNGNVTVTGGEIVGGFGNTQTYENGCILNISGEPVISVNSAGFGLTRGKWNSDADVQAALSLPVITVGELGEKASIALGTAGYNTFPVDAKYLANFSSALDDAEVYHFEERIYLGKVACICGGTAEQGPCAEGGHKLVAWMPWNGTATVSADGNYYLTADADVSRQFTIGSSGRPTTISVNINGHTLTNGTNKRIFQLWGNGVLNIADHKGGGALITKGVSDDNFGIIQMLGKEGTVNYYSGVSRMADTYVSHKTVALIEAAGTFNMYGGEISGGANPTATLVNVGGTFNMYAGTVKDGYNGTIDGTTANRGGNFRVSGTLNVYGGTITGGKAKYGGNIAATGKVNVYGGTISDGHGYTGEAKNYPQGGNIWLTGSSAALNVNGKATVSGGKLTGSSWMPGGNIYANSKATITIDGGAVVTGGDSSDGNNIYLASDGTTLTLKDCTIENTVDNTGNIMVERGNVTIDGATIINTANGYNLRANETTKVANYTFNSGLITGGKPNVILGGDDTFVMNGGTIENGSNTNGGNISLSSSDFTLNGGTIVGGTASGAGGNIALAGACELVINGGEIKNGTANGGTGGNIVIWDSSVVTLNDGVISGGTASGNGGNINVSATNTMTINGGTISGGTSGDSGGNIVCYGKLVMTGGEVLNGQCKNPGNGMNISVVKSGDTQLSTLEITGGKIGGGLHFNNYTGNVVVSISGNPVIDKTLSTEVTPTYSMKLDKNDLTIGTLTEGAKIVVSGKEGVFTYAAPEGSDQYFHSEVDGLAVWQIDGELVLVYGKEASCVCGVNSDDLADHIGECDGVKHNWLPVSELPTTSGYYYLISDVTDSGDQRILKPDTVQDIYLDLNGKTVTSSRWRMFRLDKAVNLTVTDNSANRDGKIVVPANRDQGAVVWFFDGESTFSMYGGIIDASAANNNSKSAGLAIGGSTGTVKLFGGTIIGGTYDAESNPGGSAVALYGNRIHYFGNVEITGSGSAIYIDENSVIDLSNVTKAPETPWTVDASGVFTKGWNSSWKIEDYFASASAFGAQIYLDEATGELAMGVMDCVCRQATCVGDCDGTKILWQPWRSNSNIPTATGNYYLTADVSGIGQKGITGITKAVVRVDLNGKTITSNAGSRMYLLQNENELYFTDSVGTGTVYGGGHSANGGIFLIQGTAVLKIYGGNYTFRSDATATPTGGWIDASSSGVSIYGGNFTSSINGGSLIVIRDNKTMNIAGGTFTNTATGEKAQVTISLWTGATLNISGGTINTTGTNQRNLTLDGTVNMTGGTVKGGNLSTGDNGASILINRAGTFNLSGGLVTGGTAANQGGNFAVYGKLNVSGGTIKDGVSKVNAGHNIAVISPNSTTKAVLNISGGTIAGGVYVNAYYTTPTITLSGKPVIDKAQTSSGAAAPAYGIQMGGDMTLDVKGLTGGNIHVKYKAGQFAVNATEAMVAYFTSETYEGETLLPVCYDNGGLYFGKVYCLCGASETGGTHTQGCLAVNGGEELIWVPASSTADLMAGGNFYLTESFTTGMITLSKDTVIDLNGHTLTKADGQRIVSYHGSTDVTLTVTDSTSAKNGAMVVSGSKTNQGGLFWLSGTNSKLNLVAGTFDASGYTVAASGGNRYGAGIEGATTSEINIYQGVTLKGGTVAHGNSTNNAFGGSIGTGGKLNIYGGTISGGNAVSGGNIYGTGNSTITISGGTITGGTATGEKITVDGTEKEHYGLGGNIRADGVLTISGGTIEKGSAVYGETAGWVAGGNIFASKTVTISGGTISGGTSDSQGGNIYLSGSAKSVTISGGTITDGSSVRGGNFYMDKGCVVTMSAGTVKDGVSTADGGNFSLIGASQLTVTGGQISGGTAVNGGNFYMEANSGNNPTLDVKNITVSGGTASYGGNLYIKAGTASFTGATITGGTANHPTEYGRGGNLYTTGGTVNINAGTTMSGGTLVNGNGKSWKPGANGYLDGGTINIKGTVSSTGGASQGHNFYINAMSVVNIDGGTVESSGENAENIYIRRGTLNIDNGGKLITTGTNSRNIRTNDEGSKGDPQINLISGTITGGNMTDSGSNGGSIYLTADAVMTVSGGEITGGKTANGGGLIANYGTLNISGGKIYGGSAVDGIRANIYSQGVINISGGEVWGGVTMHNVASAELNVSGAAVINGKLNATAIPGVTFWSYESNPYKPLTITGKLTGTACIGINMSDWAFANAGDYTEASMGAFYADDANQGIYLLDSTDSQPGMLYVGQYNCICGGTATEGACADGGHQKVRWTPWNGTDALDADGNYYLTADATVASQITLATDTRPANVSLNLNGHTLTVSYRLFQLWDTAEGTLNLADHKGDGKILAMGHKENFGIVQIVKGTHTVNIYSGYYGFTETHSTEASISLFGAYGTNCVTNVYGATIDGGTTGITGTLIEIGAGHTFNLFTGATVKNGQDDRHGGNFRVNGTLNIMGGTVEGGQATVDGGGGNIYITGSGVVNLSSGTVKNGFGTKQGGNFRIDGSATLNVTGGTIENGLSADCGGNIYANGLLTVSGGTITGGKKAASATATTTSVGDNSNVYLVNGDLTMTGGTIDGLNACNTAANGCIINISGKAKITNANGFGLCLISWAASGSTAPEAPVINLGTLDASASICVRGQLNRVFGTGTGAIFENKGYFTSNDGYQVICTEEGMMMVAADAHAHCECGGTKEGDEGHTCVDVIYEAVTSLDAQNTKDLAERNVKYWYVNTDEIDTNTWNISYNNEVHLCLNGNDLQNNGRIITMHEKATDQIPELFITSCEDGAKIYTKTSTPDRGRGIWVRNGDVSLTNVTVDVSSVTNAYNGENHNYEGLGISVGSGRTLTMHDVTIIGGMTDGDGSALYNAGKVIMSGNIDIHTDTEGSSTALNVANGAKIDISGLESVAAPIKTSASGVFTIGADECELKVEEIFACDITGMDVFTSVNTDAGEAFLGKVSCLCGSTTGEHIGECDGSRLELAAWRSKSTLPRATGNYILTSGAVKTPKNTPNDGAKIVVNLNGQTVTGNANDRIYTPLVVSGNSSYQCSSATLDIVNGTMIPGASGTQGGVFWMGSGTKVSLYNVTVDARGRTATGSGTIADTAAGSIFNMFGKTTLYGGTTANNGGTMAISGQLNMWDDSKIIGGTTTIGTDSKGVNFDTTGGAVYVRNAAAVVTMNDNAIIQDGEAQYNGGNVYISSGKLIMNDNAQILNGKAGNISGNIQISSGQTLEMNGGKISGGISYYNTEGQSASAIHSNATILNNGILTMTGGEIAGYVNAFAYGAGCSPKITLSGTAKICGGTTNLNMKVDNGDLFTITIGEGGLTDGADIQITNGTPEKFVSGTTIVTNVSSSDVAYISGVSFLYDNTEKIITLK